MRSMVALCLLFLAGCGRNDALSGPVAAKVNDYAITAEEFKRELALADKVNRSFPESAQKSLREGVLDNLIVRQVLLEEAQKRGFDKDPAFMREIESYWRQALLKALLNKKNAELLAGGGVDDAQVQEKLDRWVEGLRSSARVEKNADEIERVVSGPVQQLGGSNGK